MNNYIQENPIEKIKNQIQNLNYELDLAQIESPYITKHLYKDLIRLGHLTDISLYKIYKKIHTVMNEELKSTDIRYKLTEEDLIKIQKVIIQFIKVNNIEKDKIQLYSNALINYIFNNSFELFNKVIDNQLLVVIKSNTEQNQLNIVREFNIKKLYYLITKNSGILTTPEKKLNKLPELKLKDLTMSVDSHLKTYLVGVPKFMNDLENHKSRIIGYPIKDLILGRKINPDEYKRLHQKYKLNLSNYSNSVHYKQTHLELKTETGILKIGLKEIYRNNQLIYVRPKDTYLSSWLDYVLAQKSLSIPYELQILLKKTLNI